MWFIYMIKAYVNKLIDELPEHIIENLKKQKKINLVLDGGFFNGSYLIGALYFLKELEKRKYIKINKLSGCSIGSLSALLYLIDELDMSSEIYNITIKSFKETQKLDIINRVLERIIKKQPNDFCKRVSGKLFISYYNIHTKEKIVKSDFHNNNQLIEYIKRSCFVPFMINGNLTRKNKYIDGIFPYDFSLDKSNECMKENIKTLYLELLGSDKLHYLLSVKNEKSNYHRILSGILDIHLFFIKESKTQMCSYLEDLGFIDIIKHRIMKIIIESIILWVVYVIYLMKKFVNPNLYKNNILFKILNKIIQDIYAIVIEDYCF